MSKTTLTSHYSSLDITSNSRMEAFVPDDTFNIEGDVKISGNIFLEGDMYQNNDKVPLDTEEEHDVEIEVVHNGFILDIGTKKFVFSDINELNDWIVENLNTPSNAKETIRKANGRTKEQQSILDSMRKIIKKQYQEPYIKPLLTPNEYWKSPDQTTTEPYPETIWCDNTK